MKHILLAILMEVSTLAHAEYIDLTGADVIEQAVCSKDGKKKFVCAALSFKGKQYFVLVDEKGEYEIYIIKEEGLELIWSRNTV